LRRLIQFSAISFRLHTRITRKALFGAPVSILKAYVLDSAIVRSVPRIKSESIVGDAACDQRSPSNMAQIRKRITLALQRIAASPRCVVEFGHYRATSHGIQRLAKLIICKEAVDMARAECNSRTRPRRARKLCVSGSLS
ncbi:hypothetical protein, partial [Caballeronia choica]|uniref:hypothetical protein n=1 Tax=Caballeronia choica TaxID=326476 RepID=UPI001F43ACFD